MEDEPDTVRVRRPEKLRVGKQDHLLDLLENRLNSVQAVAREYQRRIDEIPLERLRAAFVDKGGEDASHHQEGVGK